MHEVLLCEISDSVDIGEVESHGSCHLCTFNFVVWWKVRVIDGANCVDQVFEHNLGDILSALEEAFKLINEHISIDRICCCDELDKHRVLRVHRMHLVNLLSNTEDLLQKKEYELFFVLLVQVAI